MTIGGGHHFTALGTVVLVDARRSRRTTEAMTCITPETGYPPSMGPPTTRFGVFMDPYPFSEKFFLVSHQLKSKNDGPNFGIYALDAWGNRAEALSGPGIQLFRADSDQAAPQTREDRLRRGPARNAGQCPPGHSAAENEKGMATLFMQDVYQGMTGIERGRVKYVRVMGALEWPWTERGMSKVGVDVHRKKVYGVVKVHEDGSAYFQRAGRGEPLLPGTGRGLHVVAAYGDVRQPDAGRAALLHRLPRTCAGRRPAWHSPHRWPWNIPPEAIVPQPGDTGPRMVHYPADVQPVLNKHCVGCHSGENAKGNLDLAGENRQKLLREPCPQPLGKSRECGYGAAHFRAVPPLTHGSH